MAENTLGPTYYTDEEIVAAYEWLKGRIAADLAELKDVEKYRIPLKEVGDELNARISRSLDEMHDALN